MNKYIAELLTKLTESQKRLVLLYILGMIKAQDGQS